jgi:hypothetical protein
MPETEVREESFVGEQEIMNKGQERRVGLVKKAGNSKCIVLSEAH